MFKVFVRRDKQRELLADQVKLFENLAGQIHSRLRPYFARGMSTLKKYKLGDKNTGQLRFLLTRFR